MQRLNDNLFTMLFPDIFHAILLATLTFADTEMAQTFILVSRHAAILMRRVLFERINLGSPQRIYTFIELSQLRPIINTLVQAIHIESGRPRDWERLSSLLPRLGNLKAIYFSPPATLGFEAFRDLTYNHIANSNTIHSCLFHSAQNLPVSVLQNLTHIGLLHSTLIDNDTTHLLPHTRSLSLCRWSSTSPASNTLDHLRNIFFPNLTHLYLSWDCIRYEPFSVIFLKRLKKLECLSILWCRMSTFILTGKNLIYLLKQTIIGTGAMVVYTMLVVTRNFWLSSAW